MRALLLCLVLVPVFAFAGVDFGGAPEWFEKAVRYGSSIIAAASILTSMTPSPKDNAIVKVFKVILEALAFNFGYAKSEK